jgi:4Fe-4S ferredoxin
MKHLPTGNPTPQIKPTTPKACQQAPGTLQPIIDRNRCEGKADCVAVCPVGVFQVSTLPRDLRVGLTLRGRLKGMAHRWQQAMLVDAVSCEACGLCVKACPERAITLKRA